MIPLLLSQFSDQKVEIVGLTGSANDIFGIKYDMVQIRDINLTFINVFCYSKIIMSESGNLTLIIIQNENWQSISNIIQTSPFLKNYVIIYTTEKQIKIVIFCLWFAYSKS